MAPAVAASSKLVRANVGETTIVVPNSLASALGALAMNRSARVLAGGTDFMVEVNSGRLRPETVVATRSIAELQGWQVDGDEVRIGASVTYRELLDPRLAIDFPALAQAARTVGSPPIRNAGTIGGNLGTASPAGDTLPVLTALGARVEVAGPSGTRVLAIQDFLVGPKQTALQDGELIVAVRVRRHAGGQQFLKVGTRNAMVISVASLAMVADVPARSVRIAMGSVGRVPLRAPEAEAWLAERIEWEAGTFMDSTAAIEMQSDLRRLVSAAARPIDDHRSSARYRAHAVGVLAARAAERIFSEEAR